MINGLLLLFFWRTFVLPVLPCQVTLYRLDTVSISMKHLSLAAALVAVVVQPWLATAVNLELNVTALTGGELESDWTSVYYSKSNPLLLGNDGGAATGGFHAWDLNSDTPLSEIKALTTGRTKLVTTVYNVSDKDLAVTIAMPDSIIRVFEVPSFTEIQAAQTTALGDWSALCSWRSKSLNDYVFLFGKGQIIQYLIRQGKSDIELVEIQTFSAPTEFSGCAVSRSQSKMLLSADDDKDIYVFNLTESTDAPEVTKLGEAAEDVTGIAVYASNSTGQDYLFVAQESAIAVYEYPFELLGTIALTGLEDIEVQGLSIYQGATSKYPNGAIAFAIEADDVAGFGLVSLDGALSELAVSSNTEYDPRSPVGCRTRSKICDACSTNGYCQDNALGCACFSGFTGDKCDQFQCTDNCSGRGECVGPNQCKCENGWGGLHCSFLLVEPSYETDQNGGDGDDPAIWISPESADKSRIITTTKSTQGAGLGVFDLTGKLLQTIYAGEPNNVDIIYGFQVGDRKVDLAFAACRADDTLCLFEMTSNGTLTNIPGGIQPVVPGYTVYGSCVYRSPKTNKQYLFVNEKSARYLQYELTSTSNGTLQTTLVRDFTGGSGGQVEGCVTDEENGWIFLGEEPSALWRYDAEPDSKEPGVRVAYVGDGHIYADVEGVTLVYGAQPDQGYVIVSSQGVSAYNVYRRAAPHEYVTTFTITKSADGQVDAVSNTDGITAVGTNLGKDFPHGLVVVHDDANQLPGGSTSTEASFKLVSLEKILGADALKSRNLLDDVDANWDPRKQIKQ
ncbi:putative phytase [Colletotrichum truncatum]|uniref:Phytase n=1 Tax=Colletotrichum truncatum TaxID=5467 RepID=A0ACC3Z3G0_COLTU|nr:putative phytase [Colletotrichum truncatum]XP_036585435.1 putative phytase [Colletotrichum truncatum]KAF6780690.1 putative phytase [Colletotrichum truncatum]KAF6795486.1 putative phytase [Colletotrichum truncatum]